MVIVNSKSNKLVALIVVLLGYFLIPFMITSINIALPVIGKEFSIDAVLLNWVVTSYILASSMFLIPFGKLADIYGRKKIYTYGFIVFIIGSLLSALSTSATLLISFRFLQGIGGAMIISTGLAIITSVTPLQERGKALGISVAIVYFGQSVGPFIGGVLTQQYGWRSIFYIVIPLCLIVLFLIFWKLKGEWVESKVAKFNYTSSIIYSLSFLAIMYGFSLIPERYSIWIILAGVISFLYFIWRETKVDNPLLDINLFRNNRVFAFSNLATLINYSATYAVIFLMSLYLQYIQMLTPQNAGLVLMSKTVVQGIFSPITGSLSDRIDPQKLSSLGMSFIAVALFLFAFLNSQTSLTFIIFVLIVLGIGLGLFVPPNTNAIMSSVDTKYHGISSATLATMRQTGMLVSMAVVMLIFALLIGKVEITAQHYDSFIIATKIAFVVFGILSVSGIFFSLAKGSLQESGSINELNKSS